MDALTLTVAMVCLVQETDAARLTEQLGADDLSVRDDAAARLRATVDPAVEEALRRAAVGPGEAAVRARDILSWREWALLVPSYLRAADPEIVSDLSSSARREAYVLGGRTIPRACLPRLILDARPAVVRAALREANVCTPSRDTADAVLRMLSEWPSHVCQDGHAQSHEEILRLPAGILTKCRDGRRAPDLQRLLSSQSAEVRAVAVEALCDLGQPPVESLISLLDERGWPLYEALWLCCRHKIREAIPVLTKLLGGADDRACARAAYALQQLEAREAVPAMVQAVRSSARPDRTVLSALVSLDRRAAAGALDGRLQAATPLTPSLAEAIVRATGESAIGPVIDRIAAERAVDWEGEWWELEDLPVLQDPIVVARLIERAARKGPCRRFASQCLRFADRVVARTVARRLLSDSSDTHVQVIALVCLDARKDNACLTEWAERTLKNANAPEVLLIRAASVLRDRPRPVARVVDYVLQNGICWELLPSFASEADVGRLQAALRKSEWLQGREITRALWLRGGAEGRAAVEESLADPAIEADVLGGLAEADPDHALALLNGRFDDKTHAPTALEIRAFFWPECWVSAIKSGTRDAMRRRMLELWNRELGEEARVELVGVMALQLESEDVRKRLKEHCGRSTQSGERALEILLESADDAAVRVHRERQLALFRTTLKDSRGALVGNSEKRRLALRAMGALHECDDLKLVLECLERGDPQEQLDAARALRSLRKSEAAATLRRVLERDCYNVELAVEIARALKALGDDSWGVRALDLMSVRGMAWRVALVLELLCNPPPADERESRPLWIRTGDDPAHEFTEWLGTRVECTSEAAAVIHAEVSRRELYFRKADLPGVIAELNLESLERRGSELSCRWSQDHWVVCTLPEAVRRLRGTK